MRILDKDRCTSDMVLRGEITVVQPTDLRYYMYYDLQRLG
jgi:hypothetical protein